MKTMYAASPDRYRYADPAPLGPKGQGLYPEPPSDEWCSAYPIRHAEFILDLELALFNEATPYRRHAIIQSFLNRFERENNGRTDDVRAAAGSVDDEVREGPAVEHGRANAGRKRTRPNRSAKRA